MEVGQQVRHGRGEARGHHADSDPAPRQAGELVDNEPRSFDGGERGLREGQHGGADLGQPDRATRTVQQGLTELSLQPADLRAHPRLRHMHFFRRASEVRFLHNRHEVLKLPKFHNK